jgi:hypothetical protein
LPLPVHLPVSNESTPAGSVVCPWFCGVTQRMLLKPDSQVTS